MKVESVKSVPGALLLLNLIHLKAFSNIIRSICLKPVDRPWGWQNQCKFVIFWPFFGVFQSKGSFWATQETCWILKSRGNSINLLEKYNLFSPDCNLIPVRVLAGKVNTALHLLSNSDSCGVLPINETFVERETPQCRWTTWRTDVRESRILIRWVL